MINQYPVPPKQHLLTIGLEDYFQVGTFDQVIKRERWDRFESRFEQSTIRVLDLLDQFGVRATFFVLGWIADRQPDLVREVARRGHEIACRSYYNRGLRQMARADFRDDLARSREAVERASGAQVLGFRTHEWPAESDIRVLEMLADEGYAYHFCIVPILRSFRLELGRRFAHKHQFANNYLWEIPISTFSLLGWRVPIAGGNYLRQLPHGLVKRAIDHWVQSYNAPLIMYFRTWELDPGQPRISAVSHLAKLRHYRNLDKMSVMLEDYFTRYRFVGIAEHFGFGPTGGAAPAHRIGRELTVGLQTAPPRVLPAPARSAPRGKVVSLRPESLTPVGVIVPCFNEELALPYLAKTLAGMIAALENQYELHFIFVDDGSTDRTWDSLREIFGSWPHCRLVQHARNRGVAAAIMTGIQQTKTPIVCSIDCDCSYDPQELRNMIPRLTAGVDLVTASPYHPQGNVLNVPSWRLALSKASSFLYRRVLRQKLFTYTSCFRVYRRSAVADLALKETGFLGVAEMLGRLDLAGSKVVEHPAVLEVRLFGQSKMAVLRTIIGHLWLLAHLLAARLRHDDNPGKAPHREKLAGPLD